MKQIQIFSTSSANFIQQVDIDNILINLLLRYNIRNERWHMSLESENFKLDGLKLVENFPLIYVHKANFPELSGDFFVVKDIVDIEDNITYDNLGNGWNLYYFDKTERDDWGETNQIVFPF